MKKLLLLLFLVSFDLHAMVKTAGVGHFTIPTAPVVGNTVSSGIANAFTASPASFGNAPADIYITQITVSLAAGTNKPTYVDIEVLVTASKVDIEPIAICYTNGTTGAQVSGFVDVIPPIPVANGNAITVASADSVGGLGWTVLLTCINQSNVVAATTENGNVLQWNTTNVASPATAGIPEVNVKNINNVATTSVTTVNANQGTTQPENFTGTGGSALVKADAVDVGGVAQTGVDLGTSGGSLESGTAQSGSASTITLRAGASGTDSTYVGEVIRITGGTGAGQARTVTSYVASSRLATVDYAWATNPDNTSVYALNGHAPKLDSSLKTTVNSIDTNGDKTGYTLIQAFPTNFSALTITGGKVDVNNKTGFSISGVITTLDGLHNYDGSDTPGTGTLLGRITSALNITSGAVDVHINNDKTGYSLTQTFPTNFSSLVIDGNGRVDVSKILGVTSVGAGGYVGIDWSKITNQGSVVNLANTTIDNLNTAPDVNVQLINGVAQTGRDLGADTAQLLTNTGTIPTMIEFVDGAWRFSANTLSQGPGGCNPAAIAASVAGYHNDQPMAGDTLGSQIKRGASK